MSAPEIDPSPELLFAYGTLAPADAVRAEVEGWSRDAVRGHLYDLGIYPGLIDLDAPQAPWVEGYVRTVDSRELSEHLDPYEGVDEHLFERVATTTRENRRVWIYVYARKIPVGVPGPLRSWSPPPTTSIPADFDSTRAPLIRSIKGSS
ncbi:MAG: gamma-glutamylcyclotransferase family protein [Isosphaeraceae bacterium]|nr:gamma-glutamylcyclotransferase family protein [Isosphaeraceae bacterium]